MLRNVLKHMKRIIPWLCRALFSFGRKILSEAVYIPPKVIGFIHTHNYLGGGGGGGGCSVFGGKATTIRRASTCMHYSSCLQL